jgi:hypothetical protein
MKPTTRALAVAVIQALIVIAVGGKLLYDRATLPRVWVETAGVDPALPIRGRYVSLRLVVDPVNPPDDAWLAPQGGESLDEPVERLPPEPRPGTGLPVPVRRLFAAEGGLQAELELDAQGKPDYGRSMRQTVVHGIDGDRRRWMLSEPVAFFLPENAEDPTRLEPGAQLWAEVTLPVEGAPRPIRLEVRR